MPKDIPRPFKSPWAYAAAWRAGDAYAGRRWAVINISHNLFVSEFATEQEAKADIKSRKRYHAEAMRAARQAAKGNTKAQKILEARKLAEYLETKKKAKFFKTIPFPA